MNFPSVSHFIAFLSMRIVILPLLVALLRWRWLQAPERIFAGLMAYRFAIALVSAYLLEQHIPQNFLGAISLAIDARAMGLMYGLMLDSARLRFAVRWGGAVFAGLCLLNGWIGEGVDNGISSVASGVECLLVAGLATVYCQQRMADARSTSLRTDSLFLINAGLLLISLTAFPLYFFVKPLLSYSRTLALRTYDLMFLAGIAAKLLYTAGFWFSRRRSVAVGASAVSTI